LTALETNKKRPVTAKEAARRLGVSERTIRRLVATPRSQWIRDKAEEREAIRRYHDDDGHTWPETCEHFGLSIDTVRRRTYRARKERLDELSESDCQKTVESPLA